MPVKTAHLLPPQESQSLFVSFAKLLGNWNMVANRRGCPGEQQGKLQTDYLERAPSQKLTGVRPGYYSNGRLRAPCPMICLPGRNVEAIRHFLNMPKEERGLKGPWRRGLKRGRKASRGNVRTDPTEPLKMSGLEIQNQVTFPAR